MESLDHVRRLMHLGQFRDALDALEHGSGAVPRGDRDLLRAELLEHVGASDEAVALATTLSKLRQLPLALKSRCEAIIGRVLFDDGDAEGGLARLQRSALMAQQANDDRCIFDAKLPILAIVSDRSGPAAGSSLLAEVRELATKLGDPQVTARLHLFVAQTEAKRGLLDNAKRHTALARRILQVSPNIYLEAFIGNVDLGIGVLRSEFDHARAIGVRAAELAKLAGAIKIYRAIVGNLGNLFFEMGDFERASEYFQISVTGPPPKGAFASAVLDSLARVHLVQNRMDSCDSVLDQIESSIQVEQDRLSYEHRHAALTRLHLLASRGELSRALRDADSLLELATRAGDNLLFMQAQLTKAELLQDEGRISASVALIAEIVPSLSGVSPEFYGRSEQVIACALAFNGDNSGVHHYARARRIYSSIGSVPRLRELDIRWDKARSGRASAADAWEPTPQFSAGVRFALHGIATSFAHAERADLAAQELQEGTDRGRLR